MTLSRPGHLQGDQGLRLPDFVIIGAAKAGTTSLYAMLDRHPQIFMPRVKEPEFFARDDRYEAGLAAYARLFEGAAPGQLAGEASTLYSLSPFFPQTAARIARDLPEAKLIYVLRDPVERAYSYYVQLIKGYQNATKDYAVHRTFEEFILPERRASAAPRDRVFGAHNAHLPDDPDLCLAGSDYLRQIEAYLAHVPRERILFLKFETFRADRAAVLRQITDFLGLDPLPPEGFDEATTRNVSATHFEQVGRQVRIQGWRRRLGPLWALRRLVPGGLHDRLRGTMTTGAAQGSAEPPPMAPETRALLAARFAPDLPRLAALTGLDLSDWDLAAEHAS